MTTLREQQFNEIKQLAGDKLVSEFSQFCSMRTLLTFMCSTCHTPYKTTGLLYKNHTSCDSCNQYFHTSRDSYISKCQDKFGHYYDYSELPEHFDDNTTITIICPKHGMIPVTASQHADTGKGCDICKIDNITSTTNDPKTDFVFRANQVHDFRYRYEDVVYSNPATPVSIKCPKHGKFERVPTLHLKGRGCTICDASARPISDITHQLKKRAIDFCTEKTFPGCSSEQGRALRFDVYIPSKNLCVEYDGVHHFQPTKYTTSTTDQQAHQYFEVQQRNDQIKSEYCRDNNINLIRIPYTDYNPGITVSKYIDTLNDERYICTRDDLHQYVHDIINYIKTFNYSKFAVYGISRGGLPIAVPVSNHFDSSCEFGIIKFQRYDGCDKTANIPLAHDTEDLPIFLIDDLISSGITMKKATSELQQRFPNSVVHPIVVFGEQNQENIFCIRPHPRQWIVFPYEL